MRILSYFSKAPLFTKLFIFLRLASCPFEELLQHVPQKGKLLDVGCGFGLLSLFVSQRDRGRSVMGIDPDQERITLAQSAAHRFPKLRFTAGSIHDLPSSKKFSVITINDVLYLLPKKEKIKMLEATRKLLLSNGVLLIKINDRDKSLSYFLTWLQEKMTVHLLKKTTSGYSGLYFENVSDIHALLRKNHFHIQKTVRLKTPFPFFHPHWLIVAEKK